MKKTGDKFFDFLYNIMDYIIVAGILAIIILIISTKLDILFEDNTYVPTTKIQKESLDISPTTNDNLNNNSGLIIEEEVDTEEITIGNVDTIEADDSQKNLSSNIDLESGTNIENETLENPQREVVVVTIPSGNPTYKTGELLVEKGLLSSAKEFEQKAIETGFDRKIRAGTFEIPKNTPLDEIFKIITKSN